MTQTLTPAQRRQMRPYVVHMRWLIRELGATRRQAAKVAVALQPWRPTRSALLDYLDGCMVKRRRLNTRVEWERPCLDPDRNESYVDHPAYVRWQLLSGDAANVGTALLWRSLNAQRARAVATT